MRRPLLLPPGGSEQIPLDFLVLDEDNEVWVLCDLLTHDEALPVEVVIIRASDLSKYLDDEVVPDFVPGDEVLTGAEIEIAAHVDTDAVPTDLLLVVTNLSATEPVAVSAVFADDDEDDEEFADDDEDDDDEDDEEEEETDALGYPPGMPKPKDAKVSSTHIVALSHTLEALRVRVDVSLMETSSEQFLTIEGHDQATTLMMRELSVIIRSSLAQAGVTDHRPVRVTLHVPPGALSVRLRSSDLGIWAAVMALYEPDLAPVVQRLTWLGELSLAGAIRATRGDVARLSCGGDLVAPWDLSEAQMVGNVRLVGDVTEVLAALRSGEWTFSADPPMNLARRNIGEPIFVAPRIITAMECAAAGAHGLLLVGRPGSGRTMLARRLSWLMPPLEYKDAVRSARMLDVAGLMQHRPELSVDRPFRAPHYTVSNAGLLGKTPSPWGSMLLGERQLAELGVLFLDEVTEFNRTALEAALPRPGVLAPDGRPSCVEVVAATAPCACGYGGSTPTSGRKCACSPESIARHVARIPALDMSIRLGDGITMAEYDVSGYAGGARVPMDYDAIHHRVARAWRRQARRYAAVGGTPRNGLQPGDPVTRLALTLGDLHGRAPTAQDYALARDLHVLPAL